MDQWSFVIAAAIFVHAQGLISNPSVWRDRFVLNSKYFNTDYIINCEWCACNFEKTDDLYFIKTLQHTNICALLL